jgi:hypothetical protein
MPAAEKEKELEKPPRLEALLIIGYPENKKRKKVFRITYHITFSGTALHFCLSFSEPSPILWL